MAVRSTANNAANGKFFDNNQQDGDDRYTLATIGESKEGGDYFTLSYSVGTPRALPISQTRHETRVICAGGGSRSRGMMLTSTPWPQGRPLSYLFAGNAFSESNSHRRCGSIVYVFDRRCAVHSVRGVVLTIALTIDLAKSMAPALDH